MAYRLARISPEPSIIGVTNGLYQMEIVKKNFPNNKLFDQFILSFESPESISKESKSLITSLDVKLLKKARITDFLGYSPILTRVPFVVSRKCLDVLTKFSLKNYNVIEVEFIDNEADKNYLFWYPYSDLETINFKESIIYSGGSLKHHKRLYHQVSDYNEYLALADKYLYLDFEKMVMNKHEENYDLIWFWNLGRSMFFSPRLEKAIADSGLSGLEFADSPILEFE